VVVVAVERVDLELHRHAHVQVGGAHAAGDLPQDDESVVVELDRRQRVRLERVGGDVRRRWCVVVLGVRPHPPAARQLGGLERVGVALVVRARALAGREHDGGAHRAPGADEVGFARIDREPPLDRGNPRHGF